MGKRRHRPKTLEEKQAPWYEKLYASICNSFMDSLPSEEIVELPTSYMYGVGLFMNLVGWSLFLMFLYNGVMSSITQKYLSLDINAGVCDYVKKSISGEFKTDYLGIWEGSLGFLIREPSIN